MRHPRLSVLAAAFALSWGTAMAQQPAGPAVQLPGPQAAQIANTGPATTGVMPTSAKQSPPGTAPANAAGEVTVPGASRAGRVVAPDAAARGQTGEGVPSFNPTAAERGLQTGDAIRVLPPTAAERGLDTAADLRPEAIPNDNPAEERPRTTPLEPVPNLNPATLNAPEPTFADTPAIAAPTPLATDAFARTPASERPPPTAGVGPVVGSAAPSNTVESVDPSAHPAVAPAPAE